MYRQAARLLSRAYLRLACGHLRLEAPFMRLPLQKGQQYRPHHDFFWDTVNSDTAHGGQRIATVLMYL